MNRLINEAEEVTMEKIKFVTLCKSELIDVPDNNRYKQQYNKTSIFEEVEVSAIVEIWLEFYTPSRGSEVDRRLILAQTKEGAVYIAKEQTDCLMSDGNVVSYAKGIGYEFCDGHKPRLAPGNKYNFLGIVFTIIESLESCWIIHSETHSDLNILHKNILINAKRARRLELISYK